MIGGFPLAIYLLLVAIIILSCILFNKLTSKLGVPMLLAFIVLGMLFGSDGIVKIPFANYKFAEQVCSTALIFIIFYGGFGTNWREAKPVAIKSILLSTVGVLLTAGLTALFCRFALNIEWLESMFIGAVVSSTDAASVFSILRSKKLGLRDNTASMLEVESGSNDPCSYLLTAIVLFVMSGTAQTGAVAYLIFTQMIFGILCGLATAFAASFVLRRYNFGAAGFDSAFTLAVAIFAYAISSEIGGNGYLSVYIAGIILGNSKIKNKQSLVYFFDGVTGLMQMLIFFLLGLLSFPSQLPQIVLSAVAISLFLTFIARPLAVFAILTPMKSSTAQQLLVSFAGLRGAASIVFAMMALSSNVYTKNDIFHIVFFIVLLSISFQGTLIPFVARKLDMIDDNANVLKTFSDYSEEVPVQFIKLIVTTEHAWLNKTLKEITVPPDTLLVMLLRDKKRLIPNGNTILKENDIVILSAPAYQDDINLELVELKISADSTWCGKSISEFSTNPNQLVILIKRHGEIIIPNGQTVLVENDVLVMNSLNVA